MTCVSSGTISFALDTDGQAPRSTSSRRTIHRMNRFSRLHGLPSVGDGKKKRTPAFAGTGPFP